VNEPPQRAIGVELIEEMIFSLPVNQPVGVIHPISRRQKMKQRPMKITGHFTPGRHRRLKKFFNHLIDLYLD
jgi:hypothetical protein